MTGVSVSCVLKELIVGSELTICSELEVVLELASELAIGSELTVDLNIPFTNVVRVCPSNSQI